MRQHRHGNEKNVKLGDFFLFGILSIGQSERMGTRFKGAHSEAPKHNDLSVRVCGKKPGSSLKCYGETLLFSVHFITLC